MTQQDDFAAMFEAPAGMDENERRHFVTRKMFQFANSQTQLQVSVMAKSVQDLAAEVKSMLMALRETEIKLMEHKAYANSKFGQIDSHHADCDADRKNLFRRTGDIETLLDRELPMLKMTSGLVMKLMVGAVAILCVAVATLVLKMPSSEDNSKTMETKNYYNTAPQGVNPAPPPPPSK